MKMLALFLIKGYQRFVSPFFGGRCRFYPSCSEYGRLLFEQLSFIKACVFFVKRLSLCHPFHPGGIYVHGLRDTSGVCCKRSV